MLKTPYFSCTPYPRYWVVFWSSLMVNTPTIPKKGRWRWWWGNLVQRSWFWLHSGGSVKTLKSILTGDQGRSPICLGSQQQFVLRSKRSWSTIYTAVQDFPPQLQRQNNTYPPTYLPTYIHTYIHALWPRSRTTVVSGLFREASGKTWCLIFRFSIDTNVLGGTHDIRRLRARSFSQQ